MRTPRTLRPLALPAILLLLIGAGCPTWSEMTDEERAAVRTGAAALNVPEPEPLTYEDLSQMKPEQIRAMKTVVIDVLISNEGEYFPYPQAQFSITPPDHCKVVHFHGDVGLTLGGIEIPEPKDSCGFGYNLAQKTFGAEEIIAWFRMFKKE